MRTVIVYGSGCSGCKKLRDSIENIIKQNEFNARVEYCQDISEIAKKGIISTPAVEIDGVIKVSGRVPAREEIMEWLRI